MKPIPRSHTAIAIVALTAIGWLAQASSAAALPQAIKVHAVKIGRDAIAYDVPDCRTVFTFRHRGGGKKRVCDGLTRHRAASVYRDLRRDSYTAGPRRYLFWNNTAPWHDAKNRTGPYRTAPAPADCRVGLAAGQVGGVTDVVTGNRLDHRAGTRLDHSCIASALEYAPDGHEVIRHPTAGPTRPWRVTPNATWQAADGRYCRTFTGAATIGGQPQSVYGRACRQPGGAWQIAS
jgi:surface antigen